jgi:hypothetical protein
LNLLKIVHLWKKYCRLVLILGFHVAITPIDEEGSMRHPLLSCLGVAFLIGCAKPVRELHKVENIRGQTDIPERVTSIKESNTQSIMNKYLQERPYYKSGETTPYLGLALSSGGMRSASFSIGVLKALNNSQDQPFQDPSSLLNKVDVISAVSGGSYATSWFYVQTMLENRTDINLFGSEGPYQQKLASSSASITNPGKISIPFVASLGMIPVNFLVNGIFGWHANTVPVRHFYQNQLDSEFMESPQGIRGYEAKTSQTASFIKIHRMPFFVINASSIIDDINNSHDTALSDKIFEFTPLWHGADYFGYFKYSSPELAKKAFGFGRAV